MKKKWWPKNKKAILVSLGIFFVCSFLNFLNHGQILVAILNPLLLIFSTFFFQAFTGKKVFSLYPLFLILLGFIPIFYFKPEYILIIFLQLITLGLWLLGLRIKNRAIKYCLFFLGILIIFWGTLISAKLLSWSFSFDKERSLSYVPSFQNAIIEYQLEALYLPFYLRPFVFNSSIYFYNFLANIGHFLSLKNLYDVLLIANLYPFFWGLVLSLKSNRNKHRLIHLGLLATLMVIGLGLTPDKFNYLYFSGPLLLYFVLLGLEKINTKVYVFLFLLSLMMMANPRI